MCVELEPDTAYVVVAPAGAVTMEFGELMCRDALDREESCGAHFREEYQKDGEAMRNDAGFSHVTAWHYRGDEQAQESYREQLEFECAHLMERDYR